MAIDAVVACRRHSGDELGFDLVVLVFVCCVKMFQSRNQCSGDLEMLEPKLAIEGIQIFDIRGGALYADVCADRFLADAMLLDVVTAARQFRYWVFGIGYCLLAPWCTRRRLLGTGYPYLVLALAGRCRLLGRRDVEFDGLCRRKLFIRLLVRLRLV